MKKNPPKLPFLLLTLLFTVPAFISLILLTFFTFHDEVQIVNLHQYIRALDLAGFPPRWAPDMHFNYGSPFPQFNYQLPYYLGYLFHQLGFSLTESFKLLLITATVFGTLGMFFLGLQFTSPFWSFIAATLYTYTPYRAVTTYVRGTLGETFALAVFPWLFLSLYRLSKRVSVVNVLFAALSTAALVLSHQLATILALPLILLLIFFNSLFHRHLKTFAVQLGSVFLGLLLSAYYWLPVLLEKQFIKADSPFNFYDHFPFIKQLISSPFLYGASVSGPGDYISFAIGNANLLLLAAAVLAVIFLRRRLSHYPLLLVTLIACFLVLFLMNIRSSFFWEVFPFTQMVQFPWRLLMLTTFLTPLLLLFLSPHRFSPLWAIPLLLISLWPNVSYFQPGEVFDRKDEYYLHRFLPNTVLKEGETISAEYLNHAEDYVPLPSAAVRPKELPQAKVTAIRQFEFTPIDKNPLNYRFQVGQPQTQSFIFHTFYFPGWRAAVDSDGVAITPDEQGRITFEVPIGKHQVQIIYEDTPLRRTATKISLITLIILFEWFLFSKLSPQFTKKKSSL